MKPIKGWKRSQPLPDSRNAAEDAKLAQKFVKALEKGMSDPAKYQNEPTKYGKVRPSVARKTRPVPSAKKAKKESADLGLTDMLAEISALMDAELGEDAGFKIGTIRRWKNGQEMIKTSDGWKEVPKGLPAHTGPVTNPSSSTEKPKATADKLPEDPGAYFHVTKDTPLVPVASLKTIRARPSGIENAATHMARAFNGEGGKRKPITVQANPDGTHTVLDGNSTVAVAKANNWKHMPVTLVRSLDTIKATTKSIKKGPEFDAVIEKLKPLADGKKLSKDVTTAEEHVDIAERFLSKHASELPSTLDRVTKLCTSSVEVTGRVKSLESALGKLIRKPKYQTADKLQDGTGLRVLCKDMGDVKENVKRLQKAFKVIEEEDYITKPKEGGYRSWHMIVEDRDGLQKEIQIRTPNQHVWAEWCHDIYKPQTDEQSAAVAKFKPVLDEYAEKIGEYFAAVDSGRKPDKKPDCPEPVKNSPFGCL